MFKNSKKIRVLLHVLVRSKDTRRNNLFIAFEGNIQGFIFPYILPVKPSYRSRQSLETFVSKFKRAIPRLAANLCSSDLTNKTFCRVSVPRNSDTQKLNHSLQLTLHLPPSKMASETVEESISRDCITPHVLCTCMVV